MPKEFRPDINKILPDNSEIRSSITKPISNFFKTFEPDINNFRNIPSHTYQIFKEIHLKWKNLEVELKYKNRSFPNSDFIKLFEICVDEANYTLDEGSIFHRARKIDVTNFSDKVNILINKVLDNYNEDQEELDREKYI